MQVRLEQVIRAALTLQTDGKPVTTRSVRAELGCGSYSTISRFLAELGLRALEEGVDAPLSDTIRLQATALTHALWRTAERAQEEKIKLVERQLQMRLAVVLAQLKGERAARHAGDKKLAKVEVERQMWRAERAAFKQDIAVLSKKLRQMYRKRSAAHDVASLRRLAPSRLGGTVVIDRVHREVR